MKDLDPRPFMILHLIFLCSVHPSSQRLWEIKQMEHCFPSQRMLDKWSTGCCLVFVALMLFLWFCFAPNSSWSREHPEAVTIAGKEDWNWLVKVWSIFWHALEFYSLCCDISLSLSLCFLIIKAQKSWNWCSLLQRPLGRKGQLWLILGGTPKHLGPAVDMSEAFPMPL